MTKHLQICAATACVLLVAGSAAAQVIDRQRTDRADAPASAAGRAVANPNSPAAVTQVTPFILRAVQVQGTSVAPSALESATKPFLGQTVDAAAIAKIADAVSNAYSGSDIALYTVVVPQQDFAAGVLRLVVVEGFIEHVDINGDVDGDMSLIAAYGAKIAAEKPLRKSTFQRYVSLMRDIPGLTLDIQLLKGEAVGAARLSVKVTQQKWKANFSIANRGQNLLGSTTLGLDVTINSLLRQGDQTVLSLGAPTEFNLYQFVGLSHATPLNDDGTVAQIALGYLRTRPRAIALEGEASSLQFAVSHPVIRSFDENLYVTGSIDGINSSNAILGQIPANERIRAIRLAGAYSRTTPTNALTLRLSASFGLDGLGAHVTNPALEKVDFQKLNLRAGFGQKISETWTVRLNTAVQLAGQELPTSEFQSFGGADFGRGYSTSAIFGDDGVAGSGEIAWKPATFPVDFLQGTEIYGFADRSESWLRRRGLVPTSTTALTSAGFGVRIPWGDNFSLDLSGAKPLAAPALLKRDWLFGFSLHASY